jgi:HAD superfamily hydrolase (TIGR01484 family)
VRYRALAADYDGTLAQHGHVDMDTIGALRRLAATGRKLILVTGRQVDDLLHSFPPVSIFDFVVAENGAVVYRPGSTARRTLASPPPLEFVETLRARRVEPLSLGEVVVATERPNEIVALHVIQELRLDLDVILNKESVMVLPCGVNKATGLAAVLQDLHLSPMEVVAVGDAENDRALLAGSGFGVAVANAVESLKAEADLVTGGDHGLGIRQLIDALIADDLESLKPKEKRPGVGPASRSGQR